MKYFQFLLIFVFLSCNSSPSTESSYRPNDAAPAGATTEAFSDTPDISKVTLRDGAGNLAQNGTIKDGLREGNWVEYYPNGLVKAITSYVNGKLEGLHVEMNASGQLEKRMMYHNDQLHGEYKEFRYSTVKEERNYANGKLEGIVKIYYDNGKILEEGAYKNGTRDGVSKWYDQEGNITIEYEYKNGELVKK